MEVAGGRAALDSLKAEAARLREENEVLEKQGKQLEKEVQQMKAQGAQAQAREMTGERERDVWVIELGPYESKVYLEKMEGLDQRSLRSVTDEICRTNPRSLALLWNPSGQVVAASGAQIKGFFPATQLLKIANQVAGGSGGGRDELAQGGIEDVSKMEKEKIKQLIRSYAGPRK